MDAVPPEIQQKIQHWKDRLAGLRRDNALLRFSEGKGKTIKLLMPVPQIFRSLVSEEPRQLKITSIKTEPTGSQCLTILKKLRKNANEIQREKGVNSLFVVIGTLVWNLKNEPDRSTISPILLIPVELQKMKGRDEYNLVAFDEDIILNPVLVQKLYIDYGISLHEISSEQNLTCDALLNQVRQDISESPSWKVEPIAHLALLERPKAAMLNDLEQYAKKIANHPILRGLANDFSAYEPQNYNILDAKHLDSQHPRSIFQVLDADSSQQVVIEAAKSGLSFITQGPPGTGKSQTIANIIAELVAKKKRILLVAEKPGALEVVARRLRDCGLGDLCLTLYDKETASKKGFSRSLKAAVERLERTTETRLSESFLEDLRSERKILNAHSEQLHHYWKPIEKSAFDLYGALLKLEQEGIPTLKSSIQGIELWSVDHLREVKQQLETLGLFVRFFQGKQTTLWKHSQQKFAPEIRVELEKEIVSFRKGIELAHRTAKRIYELLDLQISDSLRDIESLSNAVDYIVDVPRLLPSNWWNVELEDLRRKSLDLRDKCWASQNHYENLREKYTDDLFQKDILEALQWLHQRYGNISRLFQRGYWKIHKTIFACRKEQERFLFLYSWIFGYKQLTIDLRQTAEYLELCQTLSSPAYSDFDSFRNENRLDSEAIERALSWIKGLQKFHVQNDRIVNVVSSSDLFAELAKLGNDLKTAQGAITAGFSFLKKFFPDPEKIIAAPNGPLVQIPLSSVQTFLNTAENELDMFRDWTRYQECIKALRDMEAETFMENLKTSNVSPELWFSTLQKAVYQRWLDHIYDHFSELRDFNAQLHESKIQEFAQHDYQQYQIAQNRLREQHANQWRTWAEQPSAKEKLFSLNVESKKQKQQKSIRQFIKDMGDLVTALKPCWMLSPLAVSEYIDPQTPQFDVVIFDEASQIRTEEAVSSIMRAKQVIVVGDDQQLPPTFSFSSYDTDKDEDSNDEEVYESLLVECGKFMKDFTLRWHYRSQDESLIAFSNEQFYGSKLVTFPNPSKDSSRGVHFHYVEDGIYERGSSKPINVREAEEVAKLVLQHAQTSQQSLGIIAFSKNQADTIQRELDRLSVNNLSLAELQEDSDKFFLRHLESVQGEERDVVILSFCYGRDQKGEMGHNFGLLNKSGGDRRLNVAITRAKQKLILAASIHASDLQPEGKRPEVKCLQDYLSYVESNDLQTEQLVNLEEMSPSGVTDDIDFALQNAGYRVFHSVGRSKFPIDLAVVNNQHPHEFLLGIEIDSKTYHDYNTARDRDRLRSKVLRDLKWQIYRIWSKEWFHNRDVQVKKLVEHLYNLKNQC